MKRIKNKLKIIIDGILIPYVIFVLVTFVVANVCKNINADMNIILIQGISNVLSLFVLVPVYIAFKNKYSVTFDSFEINKLIYIIAIGFSLCIMCNMLVEYIPKESVNVVSENVYKLTEELNVYVTLFIICIVVPLTEEIIFRGFFYDTVKLISNSIIAILFTSISFALAHSDLQQVIYAFVAGLFLAYIKYKTTNIIYTVIMHCVMNLTAYIFIPTMFNVNTEKIYILFIMFIMLLMSIVRLNLFYNNKNTI